MLEIRTGDVLEELRKLPDNSVHCCVTSPPYWGLRDYSTNGQLGLEKTPEEYVAKMVEAFREVRRVLRKDGTLWLNLGDSYYGSWQNYGGGGAGKQRPIIKGSQAQNPVWNGLEDWRPPGTQPHPSLKPKDLCGIPWRVAFALQADGWWLRSDIIWAKPNPMPESVTDRPTKAHEYLFLLTKIANYFYDAEAIKEPQAYGTFERYTNGEKIPSFNKEGGSDRKTRQFAESTPIAILPNGRNKRSVWTVATAPYPEAHFATYPPDLIKPCILAGTSAKGCCAKCGSPWERIIEREIVSQSESLRYSGVSLRNDSEDGRTERASKTVGWQPTCKCCELYCSQCCIVIASNEDEKSITKGWSPKKMLELQGQVFRTKLGQQMVFAGMRGEVDSETPQDDNRQNDDDQRVCDALPSESSERKGRRLRDGASGDNGKGDWSLFNAGGSCPSHQSCEVRQSVGEFGVNDEEGSRPETEAEASEIRSLSTLPENDFPTWLCGTCRNPLERRSPETNPSVILDCFAGSGTTGAVALELGRKAILIELNPKYVELIRQRCDVTPGLALA